MPKKDEELQDEYEELLDEEDEEEDFGTKLEDWEDPYEDAKYEEWRDSKLWEDEQEKRA